MSYVFISYSKADGEFASALGRQLADQGIDTWMDQGMLQAGEDWSLKIDEAITAAYAMIVILSPDATGSQYVTYEWSFALGVGLPVIPVLCAPTDPHPRLSRLHFLDFVASAPPWPALFSAVRAAIGERPVVPVPQGAPAHVREAVRALNTSDRTQWQPAINVLANSDHPSARTALRAALGHQATVVRYGAANALVGEAAALPVLAEWAVNGDDDSTIRERASSTVSRYDDDGVLALIRLIDNPSVDVRAIATALDEFPKSKRRPHLERLLHAAEPRARTVAILAMPDDEQTDDHAWNQLLLRSLDDADGAVRLAASRRAFLSFSLLDDEAGVAELVDKVFHDRHVPVRNVAVQSKVGVHFSDTTSRNDTIVTRLGALLHDVQFFTALSAYRALAHLSRASSHGSDKARDVLGKWRGHGRDDDPIPGHIYCKDSYADYPAIDDDLWVVLTNDGPIVELGELRENAQTNAYDVVATEKLLWSKVKYSFSATRFRLPTADDPSFVVERLVEEQPKPPTPRPARAKPKPPSVAEAARTVLKRVLMAVLQFGIAALFFTLSREEYHESTLYRSSSRDAGSHLWGALLAVILALVAFGFGARSVIVACKAAAHCLAGSARFALNLIRPAKMK